MHQNIVKIPYDKPLMHQFTKNQPLKSSLFRIFQNRKCDCPCSHPNISLRQQFFCIQNTQNLSMSWFTQTLSGSIGKKVLMSLTGLFLILFLVVHLAGNLQLLFNDEGQAFNTYAAGMASNLFIKVVSYGNFFFILVHVIDGIILTSKNKAARNVRYAVATKDTKSSWASKNMALLGIITLIFLIAHLKGFLV